MTENKKPKTTDEIVARVQRLLKGLGDNADEVAQKLRRRRIKGQPKESGSCPIANYLKGQLPEKMEVQVYQSGVRFIAENGRGAWTDITPPCIDFIAKFDTGEIPDLVQAG